MNISRIKTVYVKEMIDLLRDRRTLIATIVVPVVLYPVLMLFSVQAASVQSGKVAADRISVGILHEQDQTTCTTLLSQEKPPTDKTEDFTPLIDLVDWVIVPNLEDAVKSRKVNCALTVLPTEQTAPLTQQVSLRIYVQRDQLRSRSAATRIEDALIGIAQNRVRDRLAQLNVDRKTINPIVIQQTNLTTSSSILGLILPLLLILITVTSAIYPAIDLTAGEHERGTLETLMVCPVPIIELVLGKFMTVVSIALLGATLNLASVAATVYFGGLTDILNATGGPGGAGDTFPLSVIPIILLALIPFAVLTSALLMAVCGFARSFKEAQNYITPVIMAVLVPGMIANMPGTQLQGAMLVLPVGNMVLLLRDLLSGAELHLSQYLMVLGSTCLYAGGAVALATQTYGREVVLFSDTASMRSLLRRNLFRKRDFPSVALASLYVACLFPAWFYLQNIMQKQADGQMVHILKLTAIAMPLAFVLIPGVLLWYWKINIPKTLALSLPSPRYWFAAVLIGSSMWVVGAEVFAFQEMFLPIPQALIDSQAPLEKTLAEQPLWLILLFIAVIPAVTEELLFRGFLLSSLRQNCRPWVAMILVAGIFALFHFLVYRFAITFILGMALVWLCWQSRSIWPAVLAHFLNNALAVIRSRTPQVNEMLNIDMEATHLPATVILGGLAILALGLWLARKPASGAQATE